MPDNLLYELMIAQYIEDKKNKRLHLYDADELRSINKAFQKVLNSKLDFYVREGSDNKAVQPL